jgi:hypothetical protein
MRKAPRYLFTSLLMTLVLCFLGVTHVFAQVGEEPYMKPVADAMISSSGISWMPKVNYTKLILNISKPDGTIFSKTFASGASPYVNLADLMTGQYIEGSYTYELRAVSVAGNKVRRSDGFSTLSRETRAQEAVTQTGYFTVRGAMIVTPGAAEPENAISTAQDGLSGTKDQVILDDLIVDGSICVGFDCVNGESFGFDTLRLKENNLRIRFYDTSSSASFPSNDWQITANDSSNGGANKFSIDDIDSGRTPFTIEAGTRANALYVDDSGRVGLGTSTPAEDLHIWYGDTPTIRLHQSGSGWAPQTWDVAGNEANFFIRDVTNGSELPFRIKPSAPTNSLFINHDGKIGLGTQSPSYPVHLLTDSSTNAEILAERTSGAQAQFGAAASLTYFGARTDNEVRFQVNSDWRLRLNPTSNSKVLEVKLGASGGAYSDGADWFPSSSREVKENINNLTDDEALRALNELNPVTYNYKINKKEERVGFIAEDVPELVAVNGRKHLNAMDIVAVLTKVVQQQQKLNQEQQKTISVLKEELAELKKKLQ